VTNSNVLVDMTCPKCGSEGPYRMSVVVYGSTVVTDDGFVLSEMDVSETGWGDDDMGSCFCLNCSFDGYVRDFLEHLIDSPADRPINRNN
jgi:hypothetical protein